MEVNSRNVCNSNRLHNSYTTGKLTIMSYEDTKLKCEYGFVGRTTGDACSDLVLDKPHTGAAGSVKSPPVVSAPSRAERRGHEWKTGPRRFTCTPTGLLHAWVRFGLGRLRYADSREPSAEVASPMQTRTAAAVARV